MGRRTPMGDTQQKEFPRTRDIEQMLQVLPGLRNEIVNASDKG